MPQVGLREQHALHQQQPVENQADLDRAHHQVVPARAPRPQRSDREAEREGVGEQRVPGARHVDVEDARDVAHVALGGRHHQADPAPDQEQDETEQSEQRGDARPAAIALLLDREREEHAAEAPVDQRERGEQRRPRAELAHGVAVQDEVDAT